jgi:hypothetical protein
VKKCRSENSEQFSKTMHKDWYIIIAFFGLVLFGIIAWLVVRFYRKRKQFGKKCQLQQSGSVKSGTIESGHNSESDGGKNVDKKSIEDEIMERNKSFNSGYSIFLQI